MQVGGMPCCQNIQRRAAKETCLCGGLLSAWLGLLRAFAVEAGHPLGVLRHGLLGRARPLCRPLLRLLSRALGGARCALRCVARCACCALQALLCPLCGFFSPRPQRLCCLQCLLCQRGSLQQANSLTYRLWISPMYIDFAMLGLSCVPDLPSIRAAVSVLPRSS